MINQDYTGNERIIDLIKKIIFLSNNKGPLIQSDTYRELLETLENLLKELKFIEEKSSNEVDERTSELEILKQKHKNLKNRIKSTHFIQSEEQKYISNNSEEEQKLSYSNTPQYKSLMREILSFQTELDDFIQNIKSLLIDRFSYVINIEDEEDKDINIDIDLDTMPNTQAFGKERNNNTKNTEGFSLQTLLNIISNKDIKKISKTKACQLIEEMIGEMNVSETPEVFTYINRYDNYHLGEINGKKYVILNGLSSLNNNKGDNCLICSDNQCMLISSDNLHIFLHKVRFDKENKYQLFMKMPLDENSGIYVNEKLVNANQETEYDMLEQEDGRIAICSRNKKESVTMIFNSIEDISKCEIPREFLIYDKKGVQTIFYKEDENELYSKSRFKGQYYDIKDQRYSYEEVMKECRKICDESLVLSKDDLMLVHRFLGNGIRGAISYDDSLKILQEIQPNLAKHIREYRGSRRRNSTKTYNSSSEVSNGERIPRKAKGQRRLDFKESLQVNIDKVLKHMTEYEKKQFIDLTRTLGFKIENYDRYYIEKDEFGECKIADRTRKEESKDTDTIIVTQDDKCYRISFNKDKINYEEHSPTDSRDLIIKTRVNSENRTPYIILKKYVEGVTIEYYINKGDKNTDVSENFSKIIIKDNQRKTVYAKTKTGYISTRNYNRIEERWEKTGTSNNYENFQKALAIEAGFIYYVDFWPLRLSEEDIEIIKKGKEAIYERVPKIFSRIHPEKAEIIKGLRKNNNEEELRYER